MVDPKFSIKQTVIMPITGECQTAYIDKSKYTKMAIFTPSAWTSADVTFLGCMTPDGTYVPIEQASDGAEVAVKVEANKVIGLDSAALKNALEAIPFIKLRSGNFGELEVEDCEDAWNELADADLTQTVEATDIKKGSGALKWVIAAGMAAGDIIATEVISKDLTAYKTIRLWIKCSVATAAGNLKLLLDDTAQCASPLETLSIPALAANTWTEVNLTLADPSLLGSLISIGVEYDADLGECTIYVDDIRATKEILQAAVRSFDIALFR
jgi:hypothetical protein